MLASENMRTMNNVARHHWKLLCSETIHEYNCDAEAGVTNTYNITLLYDLHLLQLHTLVYSIFFFYSFPFSLYLCACNRSHVIRQHCQFVLRH